MELMKTLFIDFALNKSTDFYNRLQINRTESDYSEKNSLLYLMNSPFEGGQGDVMVL